MSEYRVWDAAMVEYDDDGLHILVHKGDARLRSRGQGTYQRLMLPDRFADIVLEAKRTNRPIRLYYKDRLTGPLEAELVELA